MWEKDVRCCRRDGGGGCEVLEVVEVVEVVG